MAQLAPERSPGQFLTGAVAFRRGRWQEAVAAFERGIALRKGDSTAFYDYFLAICHHYLGNAAKARDCFARGDRWSAKNRDKLTPRQRRVLDTLRAEAAAVLRITEEAITTHHPN